MKIKKWGIVPYIRVGPIAFNINQNEARGMLGKERLKYFDKDENETILYWQENALQLIFDGQGLSMIGFYPNIENILIGDIMFNWSDTVPVFKWFLDSDQSAMTDVGIFVFLSTVFLFWALTLKKLPKNQSRLSETASGHVKILYCDRLIGTKLLQSEQY